MTWTGSPDRSPPSALASPFGDHGASVPPRPSATLLTHVAGMKPVRPRAPRRSLLIVALAACAYPAWALITRPFRPDLAALPAPWVITAGALWLAGFILPLTCAVLPGTGQVVPDGKRAFRTACLTAVALIGVSLFVPVEAFGGRSTMAASEQSLMSLTSLMSLMSWRKCVTAGLKVSAPAIMAGALALRRVAIVEAWRLGAAVGAASGALAGLTLHLSCPDSRPVHVALAHGGGVVMGALAGALSLLLIERTRR
jgi:hypothetical protein